MQLEKLYMPDAAHSCIACSFPNRQSWSQAKYYGEATYLDLALKVSPLQTLRLCALAMREHDS